MLTGKSHCVPIKLPGQASQDGGDRDVGEWRENTAKESTREIRSHLLPDLGEISFEELKPALLRAILNKAEQGMGRQILNHLRGYRTDICRSAVAEGYLVNNVAEG